jgi:SH3-like domain-containing protein
MNNYQYIFAFRACLLAAPIVLALAGSPEAKSIGKDQVNIRSEPSLSSPIIFTAPLGYPIEIKKEVNNWTFFYDWQNTSGWVYKPLVSNVDTAVILVDKANIRSTSTLESKVVNVAQLGEIYRIIAKEDNWVQLGYFHGGTELGWVRSDLVFGD